MFCILYISFAVHMKIFYGDSIQSFDFTMFYKQITLVLARILIVYFLVFYPKDWLDNEE